MSNRQPSEVESFGNLARVLTEHGIEPKFDGVPEMLLGSQWAIGFNEHSETWDLYPISYDDEED